MHMFIILHVCVCVCVSLQYDISIFTKIHIYNNHMHIYDVVYNIIDIIDIHILPVEYNSCEKFLAKPRRQLFLYRIFWNNLKNLGSNMPIMLKCVE